LRRRPQPIRQPCAADDCDQLAQASRKYCRAHRWQVETGEPLRPVRRYDSSRSRAEKAAIDLADASEDDEYERAWDRLRKTFELMFLRRGWSPPEVLAKRAEHSERGGSPRSARP
jgi:hypothetical protein